MRSLSWGFGLMACALMVSPVMAQGVYRSQPCAPCLPTMPGSSMVMPGQPSMTPTTPTTPTTDLALNDLSAQAPEQGGGSSNSLIPGMFGDILGFSGLTSVNSLGTTISHLGANGNRRVLRVPIPSGTSGYKITENESPRPQNRIYYNFNYFNNINFGDLGISQTDYTRHIIGLEKTLFSDNFSLGFRLPFVALHGDSRIEDSTIGDLSIIFKYAFINNLDTGNVLSAGMVLTLPTAGEGNGIFRNITDFNTVIFQPYVGWIYNADRFFFQGFSSIAIPTESEDITVLFNSVGAGFRLYTAGDPRAFLTSIVPVVELHSSTPLDGRNSNTIFFRDQLNVTAGAFFNFGRFSIGSAVGVPLLGPKPYDIEAIANVNWRF